MREAIGKIVTNPQAIAFPITPQSIRVSSSSAESILALPNLLIFIGLVNLVVL